MRVRQCPHVTLLALSLVAAANSSSSSGAENDALAERLLADVGILASEAYGGRGTAEEGGRLTEEHVARGFAEAGLRPLPGRSDWFLPVDLYQARHDLDRTRLSVAGSGADVAFAAGEDFRPFPFSDDGAVELPVVFAGYGITAPEHDHDDYAGLDVAGKLVLVLRHEPGERDPGSPFAGTASTSHATFQAKARLAEERGARGMLLVTDPLHHEGSDDLRLGGRFRLTPPSSADGAAATGGEGPPFLAAHVSRRVADALLLPESRELVELQRALDAGSRPKDLGVRLAPARLSVAASPVPRRERVRNVAGFLEGADPTLKNEWIVVGAHHDHLGRFVGDGDTVYNGADDNASGTAAVLELARGLAAGPRPRRSIAFVTFAAEEQGLLGSRAAVEQELLPLQRVAFMLNLDMIGRNSDQPVAVWGDGHGSGLREIVEAANRGPDLRLDFGGAGYMGASDHNPFYRRDVPFLFLFTGTHEDYHQLGDHVDKLDLPRMARIVRLARGLLERVAGAEDAPRFIHHVPWLGARIEVTDVGPGRRGALVTGLDEGSRGHAAGLREGDEIRGFDDEPLDEPEAVGRRFRAIEPGTTVQVVARRGQEAVLAAVERAPTGYLGIWPGALDADRRERLGLRNQDGLLVRRVVAEGPAAKAGLVEGDVIVQIAGQPVGQRTLSRLLARVGAGETVDVMVVREDRRVNVPVTLGERPRRR